MTRDVELDELIAQRGVGWRVSEAVHEPRKVDDEASRHVVRIHKVVAFGSLHLRHEVFREPLRRVMDVEMALRVTKMEHPIANAISELLDDGQRIVGSLWRGRERGIDVAEPVVEIFFR